VPGPYQGARIALLTQHGKERVVAPRLRDVFGAELVVVRDFDTDTLGTFTRDVPREGIQLEAARRKAKLACELGGVSVGLGSEGAFVPGPFGFGAWNVELVVLVDEALGVEIVGRAREPGLFHHGTVRTIEELRAFACAADFPAHALVIRPEGEDDPRVRKGLRTWDELEAAFIAVLRDAASGTVSIEHDLRAHLHPTRMANVDRAAEDLVERMSSPCPACGMPGFGRIGVVPGRPCRACGGPTMLPLAIEHGCVLCDHREQRPHGDAELADPYECEWCNP